VFASLEKALAIYGAGRAGERSVRDKDELVGQVRAALQSLDAARRDGRTACGGVRCLRFWLDGVLRATPPT